MLSGNRSKGTSMTKEELTKLLMEAYERGQSDLIKSCQEAASIAVDTAILAEREACAKLCEDLVPTYLKDGERWLKGRNGKPDSRLKDLAPNLEAAWEAEQLLKHGSVIEKITEAHICADAIRARGQA